ncbi:glycosyltransferase family 2 protein [Roseobacter sp.]|uniref:glycosyltransferase family 2 protein n=1 Tax=Roseobacter sp. TaxID=1907202 RepID=UPI003858A017
MSRPKPKETPRHAPDVSDIFGTVDFALKRHISPHGRVTAVSMMKDEGPYVLEWVAHHLGLGFTDLVVYTNDCSDGTDEMLTRLEELGLAHHRRNTIPEGKKPQPSALKCAQDEPVVCNSDWVMVFDADEFLCVKYGDGTLDDLIDGAHDAGANGIVITWRIFGSNGVQEWSRAPVTEQYLSAAPQTWNKGWGVKTLFKFDPGYWRLGIHRPKIKNKHLETDFPETVHWLNGSGREMETYFKFRGWRSIVRTVGYDWAQVNHYAVKSMDSYAIRKLRGNVNNKKDKYDADYWALQDRNETEDRSALRHRVRRQEILEMLLTDPVLAQLHDCAVSGVERQLAEIKQTPAYDALLDSLKAASTVPITQVVAKPPKPRDSAKIAAQMSEIERKQVQAASDARGSGDQNAHLYVTGRIDLTEPTTAPMFANQDIQLPADARVFSATALRAIEAGKFERNHARCLPDLMNAQDRYLEIGAGVGFLGAILAKRFPHMQITIQEERYPFIVAAARIWKTNGITHPNHRRLLNEPLFRPDDGQHVSSGLTQLIGQTRATILYVNDPRMSAQMIEAALKAQKHQVPERVIVGARAFAGQCDEGGCCDRLADLGYAPATDPPLDAALTLFRRDDTT